MPTMMASPQQVDTAPSSNGPVVELTLQSLYGLTCCQPSGSKIPFITAAVGFEGSATDMRVSSSFLSSSGNVLVESSPAVLPRESDKDQSSSCPLLVEWRENERSLNQSFSSTASSLTAAAAAAASQPHLTIRFAERDAKLPSVPLSKINRDCNVVHDDNMMPPSLDESDTSSHTTQQLERQHQRDLELEANSSDVRGASVVWSASGAAMPDIIELHVSLIISNDKDRKDSDDEYHQTTYPVGVAFLVFFGSDIGTTVLDLPIKKQSATTFAGVSLTEDAFLRVRVNVMAPNVEKTSKSPAREESFFADMQNLKPILQEIHDAQHQADQQQGDPDDPTVEARQGNRFLCSGDVSFKDLLKAFTGAVKQCDGGEGVLHRTDSMGSTIVTSASLGI